MVFIAGVQTDLTGLSSKTLIFLILSGVATGASWLCYFKALQLGDINKVTPKLCIRDSLYPTPHTVLIYFG